MNFANNSQICGDLPDALANAIGTSQRRSTALGQQCPWQGEADALMRFKEAMADPLGTLSSWRWDGNPCGVVAWKGVGCRLGMVTELNISRAGVAGEQGCLAYTAWRGGCACNKASQRS